MPAMEDILEMRSRPKIYVSFFSYFVRAVVGRSRFDHRVQDVNSKRDKDLATVSDEALALLLVENSIGRWTDIFVRNNFGTPPRKSGQKSNKTRSESDVMTKYTSGGIFTRGEDDTMTTRGSKGWSAEGMERYNELFSLVVEDRKKHPKWCQAFIEDVRFSASKKTKGRRAYVLPDARHELFSEDEDEIVRQDNSTPRSRNSNEDDNSYGDDSDDSEDEDN